MNEKGSTLKGKRVILGLSGGVASRFQSNALTPLLALAAAASWGVGDFSGGIATRLSNNFVAVFLAQGVGLIVAMLLLLL